MPRPLKILLALVLGVLLLEGVARIALAVMGPPAVPLEMGAEQRKGTVEELLYVWDRELFYRPRAGLTLETTPNPRIFDLSTNAHGMRGDEVDRNSSPDTIRVLCVGDSCTFGSGAAGDGTWPAQLEAGLTEALTREVEVLNAGVPGYSSYQGRRWLESKGWAFEPDALVITFGYNDSTPARATVWRPMNSDVPFSDREYAEALGRLSRTGIGELLGRLMAKRAPLEGKSGEVGLKTRVSESDYRENLLAMIAGCRERGILPIVVSWPIRSQAEVMQAGARVVGPPTLYQDIAKSVATEEGVALVELAPIMKGRPQLFIDFVHMAAEGYGLVAQAIGEVLAAELAARTKSAED